MAAAAPHHHHHQPQQLQHPQPQQQQHEQHLQHPELPHHLRTEMQRVWQQRQQQQLQVLPAQVLPPEATARSPRRQHRAPVFNTITTDNTTGAQSGADGGAATSDNRTDAFGDGNGGGDDGPPSHPRRPGGGGSQGWNDPLEFTSPATMDHFVQPIGNLMYDSNFNFLGVELEDMDAPSPPAPPSAPVAQPQPPPPSSSARPTAGIDAANQPAAAAAAAADALREKKGKMPEVGADTAMGELEEDQDAATAGPYTRLLAQLYRCVASSSVARQLGPFCHQLDGLLTVYPSTASSSLHGHSFRL